MDGGGQLGKRISLLGRGATKEAAIIIIIISLMQGIRTYIPETNHVSRVYSVAAILHVLLLVHIALSSILNSFVLLH
jgi:hypothetical protein